MGATTSGASRRKLCVCGLILSIALTLAGCQTINGSSSSGSSGSSSSGGSSSPPSVPTTVTLNPSSVTISVGAATQFSATVKGPSNTAVTWSVDSVNGGNSTAGTISATGLYTAPSVAGTHTVTATSVADTSKSAKATVIVVAQISVSPTTAAVDEGQTQQFTATAPGNSAPTVIWSVDGISGGNTSVGTITGAGLYSAPAAIGNHTIAATQSGNSTNSASAVVTVFAMSIAPGTVVINPSTTEQFTAIIQGISNTNVTWSVDGIAGGNSSTGTITSSGLYTCPTGVGVHTVMATSETDSSASVSAAVTVVDVRQASVLTYHNDDARDGAYLQEVTLTPSNVNSTQFGKILSYPVDGQIYGQPLYVSQVNMPSVGLRDVVYVVTENNSVYAFDADAGATQPTTFWHVNLGPSVPKYDSSGVSPNVGILSTPVIDAPSQTMFLVAEISGQSSPFWLYALNITTGVEVVSHVAITATYSGDTLESSCYQRMGLALNPVTNWIYIPFGSCTHGWVLAYDKTSLAQKAVFDDTAGGAGGGLWASGGAPAIDDSTGDVYLMSGVDAGDQEWITGSTQVGYNDSFLRLDPNSLSVLDYFSPDDNYTLAVNDWDLGSGGNVIVPGSSSIPNEIIGAGKDGNIFVANRDKMGGFNDGMNNVVQTVATGAPGYGNYIFSTPVYWNGSIYYHSNNDVLRAYSWNAGASAGQQLSTTATSAATAVFQMHGATASLSANGTNNGIIWDIDNSTYNGDDPPSSGVSVLHAYDATNVATELYNSSQAGTRDTAGTALKFTVPTIVNGRVFVPTANELDIYGLLP